MRHVYEDFILRRTLPTLWTAALIDKTGVNVSRPDKMGYLLIGNIHAEQIGNRNMEIKVSLTELHNVFVFANSSV